MESKTAHTDMVSEPVMAHPMTSYSDVMSYLHTVHMSPEDKRRVAKRLTLEVTGKNLSRVFERLDYLASLPADWDGYGAHPVSRQVISNLKKVLLISDDDDWKDWLIGAESNATIALQSKQKRASISLGNDEYSYYAVLEGKEIGKSHLAFSPDSFLKLMNKLSQ